MRYPNHGEELGDFQTEDELVAERSLVLAGGLGAENQENRV